MKKKDESIFDKSFWVFIIIFSFSIGLICLLPYLFTLQYKFEDLNFSTTGQIGDTIGGTMTPFIAIAAALLTFIAFWVQYKANQQQTNQFKNQAKDVTIERFENKFFELIGIQRKNTNEIMIGGAVGGRKAFISMFLEFRFCYKKTKLFIEEYKKDKLGFKEDDETTILDIAYHIFFMGIGDNSDKLVIASLKEKCKESFIVDLISDLKSVKDNWRHNRSFIFKVKLKDDPKELEYTSQYMPFGGHISRLGIYFRHLFQTVNFIAVQDNKIFNEATKCEYAKTLRAQLSDHEQLLLFYNVLSSLGKAWIAPDRNFIKRFRMIKNMPLPLADFGIIPQLEFKDYINYWHEKGKAFFEWDERN